MAGTARPDECINCTEGRIEINDCSIRALWHNGDFLYDVNMADSLLNGEAEFPANHNNAILLAKSCNNFLDFTVYQKSTIYAIGAYYSDSAGVSSKKLNLYKFDETNNEFVFVEELETKDDRNWYKLLTCESGKYRIMPVENYVLFAEWFVKSEVYHLIKKNNDLYSINDSYYDINTKEYVKIPQSTTDKKEIFINNNNTLSDLYMDKNINGETFKPANKLLPFKISKLKFK